MNLISSTGCPLTLRGDPGVENSTIGGVHAYLVDDIHAVHYGKSTANQVCIRTHYIWGG